MLKEMLSGNKYTSRSSLGSAIYQCLQQIPKEDYLSALLGKKVTKICFSKGGKKVLIGTNKLYASLLNSIKKL